MEDPVDRTGSLTESCRHSRTGRLVQMNDGQGRHCVAGAILVAMAGSPGGHALRKEARQLLQQHLTFWPTIESWNDLPWRTKNQVLAKLRAAAT